MPQRPVSSLDDEIDALLSSVQTSPAPSRSLDDEIDGYLSTITATAPAPAVTPTPRRAADVLPPMQPMPVHETRPGLPPSVARASALPVPPPQATGPVPAPTRGPWRPNEPILRSRTGEFYQPPPMGQIPILDAPVVGAQQIAQGARTLAATAAPGQPLPAAPRPEDLRVSSRTGQRYGAPPPIDPRTYAGAADIVSGGMTATTPLLPAAALAAPLTTGAALVASEVASRGTEQAMTAAGATPEQARLASVVAGAVVAGVPITGILRKGLSSAAEVARGVSAQAEAARAPVTIPPEATDITITPERQRLTAETELGRPSPPPAPEPPVAVAPTSGSPPPGRPSAPVTAAAPEITRLPDALDRALGEGRATVGRPSALPPAADVMSTTPAPTDNLDAEIDRYVQSLTDDSGRELLGPQGYAGPERRSTDRVLTDAEDAAQALYREKLARGEDVRSPQQVRQFEERQRVENYRNQAAVDEVRGMEPAPVGSVDRDIDNLMESADKEPREFSSTQVEIPEQDAADVRALAATIPDADLAGDGRETRPHATVKFGLHTADVADVRKVLADEGPITVTLGKTSTFPPSDSSDGAEVVKIDVDSPDLHRLNAKIAAALEHTDTHPDYKPHVTVAYVKPGTSEKYVGNAALEGRQITLDAITFSSKDRTEVSIPLTGMAQGSELDAGTPDQSRDEMIYRATHSYTGAQERWLKLRESGATDEEILQRLGVEFGKSGGSGGPHGLYQSHTGGERPRIEIRKGNEVLDRLHGKKLVADVRRVLQIPQRAAPPVTPLAPQESLSTGGVDFVVQPLRESGPKPPVAKKPPTPQVSALPGMEVRLPSFVTAPHAKKGGAAAVEAPSKQAYDEPNVSPEQSRASDQGALEDAPAADVREPGAERAPRARGARSAGTDRASGDRGDSAGDDAGPGAGAVSGAVGVSPERSGRAPARQRPAQLDRPAKSGRDYRISDADALGDASDGQKLTDNVAAIRLLKTIDASGRKATAEEQRTLVKYVGWGGLAHAFKPGMKGYDDLNALVRDDLITRAEYEAMRASTPNAHYTSRTVVSAIYQALDRLGFTGGRVLEPSLGVGHFFGLMPPSLAKVSALAGVELDPLTARIAQQLYQSANIQAKGFEAAQLPDNFFDVVVGNPPFGNYGIHDPAFKGRPKGLSSAIHNYFFAKAIDKVRPGGVVAFVTSHYTMDAKDSTLRDYLARHAELLGAIRLPNTAFKRNAGTEVVTDILFLQKRAQPIAGVLPEKAQAWTGTSPIDEGTVNNYFLANPRMVLGKHTQTGSMYSGKEYTVEPTGDLPEQLAAAVKLLPKNVIERPGVKATEPTVDELIPAPDYVKPYGYTLTDGKVYVREGGRLVSRESLPDATKARIKAMLPVRDAVRDTMRTMLDTAATDAQIAKAQTALNTSYDKFVQRHGFLHQAGNYRALRGDPDLPLLLSLEDWDDTAKTAGKAAIFTKRTLSPRTPVTSAETGKEALLVSLNETAQINWPRMAKLTGRTEAALQQELKGLVFQTPGGAWETADEYLSGNVRQKLVEAQAAATLDTRYTDNVEALTAVQPADLPPSDIDARLGAAWVPEKDVAAFIEHLVGVKGGVTVRYIPPLAKWNLVVNRWEARNTVGNNQTWGTARAPALDLLDQTLNLKSPTVYDRHADGTSSINQAETLAAREKQQAIKDEFKTWLWSHDERATRLARKYNDEMNNLRPRTADGAHLTLPGMAAEITLRPHQKNAIWRIIQTGNTLLDHVVGAGKTFAMVGTAMELRRLGIAKKPMIAVPNHLVEQWGGEFLRMYPAANVLIATKEDFEKGARQTFMSRIATGDWDAVVVAHGSFGRLSVSDETFNGFLAKEIATLEQYIEESKAAEGKKSTSVKELEKAKKRLEAKLKKMRNDEAKDDTLNFEDLGVDALFVDEAHLFKNLFFPTKMTRVAGLPQTESQRAFDMFLKTQHVQTVTNGRGIVFATGTPISNTMAEMYTMQRYLQLPLLEEMGLAHFDAWAQAFGETVTALELAPEGSGYRPKTRFARFTNLPELVTMFRQVADVQTADMLKLPTPPLKGGKPTVVVVEGSANLRAFVQGLAERAQKLRSGKVDPKIDNMLKITSEGRKAALDMRLIDEMYGEQPRGKVAAAAEKILERYQQFATVRGTQLVFSDLGTPRDKFNVYDELRHRLERGGIPAEEIAYIHDADTDAKKIQLFDDVNAGTVRVLVGSTEKMGAGMNVQQRLVAKHDLDAPWRPSDVEQRDGRIIRQGNTLAAADPTFEIEILRYVTEGSFDAYMWQTLETKEKFIRQAKRGDLSVRSAEDVDGGALNAAEVKALASGNPLVFEKVKVDAELRKLETLKAQHTDQQFRARRQLAVLPVRIAEATAEVARAQAIVTARAIPEDFTIQFDGTSYTDREEAQTAFESAIKEATPSKPFGRFAGLDIWVRTVFDDLALAITAPGQKPGDGRHVNPTNLSVRAIEGGVKAQPDNILAQEQAELASLEQRERDYRVEVERPYSKEARLQELLVEQKRLEQALNLDAKSQAAETAAVEDTAEEAEIRTTARGDDIDRAAKRPSALPKPGGPTVPATVSMRPSEIVKALHQGLSALPISTGHFQQRAFGIFKPDVHAIRTRVANDLPTIFHEVGHYLDRVVLGINRKDPRWRDELRRLGEPTSQPSYSYKQQREEGAAEFLRIYLVDPKDAKAAAPAYFEAFEQALEQHPETAAVLSDVQQRIRGYLAQDLATRGEMRIDSTGGGRQLPKPKAIVRAMARAWIDDLDAVQQAVEGMRDGRALPYTKNAYVLARNARGSAAKAEGFLTVGPRARSGKFLGPSLADALAPVRSELEPFGQYLVALRVLELDQRTIETGLTPEEARAIIRKAEARDDFADFERAKANVYAYQDALLEYLRQYGALNADQIAAIKKVNQFYVPFHRVKEEGGQGPAGARRYANRRTPINRIRGSGLDIVSPFESIVRNTFAIVDMVEKNTAMLALTEQAERSAGSAKWLEKVDPLQAQKILVGQALDLLDPDARELLEASHIDVDQLVTVFSPRLDPKASEKMVTVVRNGKPQVWQVHDQALYDAVVGMGPREVGVLLTAAGHFTSLLRAGATLTPGFIARNPHRDTLVAFIQSRYGFLPVVDTARGVMSLLRSDEDAKLFWTSGVAQAALVGADVDRTRARKAIRAMTAKGKRAFFANVVQHPIEALQALSALMESGSRLGEFKLALEAGGQERGIVRRLMQGSSTRRVDEEALTRATLAARDVTTDFSRGGHVARELNRAYAFFNAGVQGTVRMAETFKRDPMGTALKIGALTAISLILWLLNHTDEDPDLGKRFDNLPAWERNTYWHWPHGKTWVKIAKPFEWGFIANLTEAWLDFRGRTAGNDLYALKAFDRVSPDRGSIAKLGYGVIPQAILPLTEAMFNYASFRDTNIVRPWDVGLDPELQYSDWTTETSKNLGKLLGISPAKLDHVIFGYTAGFGRGIVEGADVLQQLTGLAPTKNRPTTPLRQLPLVGTFVREQAFDGTAQDLDDFYEEYTALQGYDASMKAYVKAGDRARFEARRAEADRYLYGRRRAALENAYRDMKAERDTLESIYKAPPNVLTPQAKRAQLDRAYERMVTIAREGLGRPPLRAPSALPTANRR